MAGYIKIYRSCRNNSLWLEKPFSRWQAFEYLLLAAAYEPIDALIKNQIVHIERGQLIRAVKTLANDWGWSVKKVINFLKLLESAKMAISKGTHEGTLITIENWALYQCEGQAEGQAKGLPKGKTRERQGRDKGDVEEVKEVEEIQEVKEDKNIYSDLPEQLIKPFEAYLEIRKLNKWKTSDYAIKLLLNKLKDLGNGNISLSEKVINQSIEKSYRSFFPVTVEAKTSKPQSQKEMPIVISENAIPCPEDVKEKLAKFLGGRE